MSFVICSYFSICSKIAYIIPFYMDPDQTAPKWAVWPVFIVFASNINSCIDFYWYSCLHPLSNERKSMFKSGDSHAVWTWVWTWKYLKWALHYLHDVIIRKALWTRLIISPWFLFAETLRTVMSLWRRYDVRKYTANAILFREIQCKKVYNLMI